MWSMRGGPLDVRGWREQGWYVRIDAPQARPAVVRMPDGGYGPLVLAVPLRAAALRRVLARPGKKNQTAFMCG